MKTSAAILVLSSLILKCYAVDIAFYGDLMLSRGIEKYTRYQGTQSLNKALSAFLPKATINIVNLEGCIGPYNYKKTKSTLCFLIQPNLMDLLKGFHVVSLENNHSLDAGPAGLQNTAEKLQAMNIITLAGKHNHTIIETDQGNIGIVAATDVLNDESDSAKVSMADDPDILNQIRELTNRCSAVIVYVHWGRELLPIATEKMRTLSAKYVEAGANIIVGTHPHVVGPVKAVEGRPVVYSLGNFLFDQKYPITKKGAILSCEITDGGVLQCNLSACETPVNSFLPLPVSAKFLRNENKILMRCARRIRRKWTGIFTGDGKEKCLALRADIGKNDLWYIEIQDIETGNLESVTPKMPIRRLQPIDFDGNGTDEVMLIQSIYSKFDKETAKRIHIYSFDNGFHALWRGTALSRPLIDATIVEKGTNNHLAALHSSDSFILRNKTCTGRIVTFYRWNGFGFSGVREMKVEEGCDAISCIRDGIRISSEGITKRVISVAEISELIEKSEPSFGGDEKRQSFEVY